MYDDTLRDWQRRARGICSDPDCGNPIAGWCATCDALGPFKAPKWCERHLLAHIRAAPGRHQPYWRYDHDGGAA
jgi:hypothetical protein